MNRTELLNALLGVHNYTPEQIDAALECAEKEIITYTCRTTLDTELDSVIVQVAIIKLNRLGTEGAQALTFSGISQNYIDGYPAHIRAILNGKRMLRVL